ncbi:hypothetical protein BN1723_002560 [Verticillium longisporum]|uniref:Uncharacterized protein n=1 Tax=Verticillium longisporum TaxID=100787 RepID=A0A0G4LBC9_VERLO|nr:hypothetical protein BN1723_002560 [Verticillium longisporum]
MAINTAPVQTSRVPQSDHLGGVSIVGTGGKIEIDNTVEQRLKLLEDTALPAVRETLFGKNPNRKFYD